VIDFGTGKKRWLTPRNVGIGWLETLIKTTKRLLRSLANSR